MGEVYDLEIFVNLFYETFGGFTSLFLVPLTLVTLLWSVVVVAGLAASLPLSGLVSEVAIYIALLILIGVPFLFAPLLFLGIYEDGKPWLCRNPAEFATNWFITPAVLLAAVIHLFGIFSKPSPYSNEIPEVVLNSFLWGMFAFYVKAVQPHLVKRPFRWIAAHIELLSIPVLFRMWRFLLLRIGEFGLTDVRVMAVVCAAVSVRPGVAPQLICLAPPWM